MSVAVTAVGGVIGQVIIKALQNTAYSVVGINSEVLGAGLYATKICSHAHCSIVFSGLIASKAIYSFESSFLFSNQLAYPKTNEKNQNGRIQ